jgi:hypothetical protein
MRPRETDLYAPIKALFESQGYEVKGEIGAADVVAVRGNEDPVIVELKTGFSLTLYHQAIERMKVSDLIYIAVPKPTGRTARRKLRENIGLCRRLGLGLITILSDGRTEVQCDPGPYAPRKQPIRKARLLREFQRRAGDPSSGGAMRSGLVTAYRQDALRCAAFLRDVGPSAGAAVAKATGVERATTLMRDNHYGWFKKVERGVYAVTDRGRMAPDAYVNALPAKANVENN